ncbi:MAG TPA: 30S ribosomal protein S20 [Salinivirgaceae bacterium]|nr:30S ribosomal protein S20 [Salinivirgaceae bacterium]
MANHKSAIKRIRKSERRRLYNRYYARTTRNLIKKLRSTTNQEEAKAALPKVVSSIQRLAKRGIIHKNKAANLTSKLTKFVNSL